MKILTLYLLLLLEICIYSHCDATSSSAVEGESITLNCFTPITNSDYFVEVHFARSNSSEVLLCKYKPDTQLMNPTTPLEGRLTMSASGDMTLTNLVVGDEGVYKCTVQGFTVGPVVVTNDLVILVRPTIEVTKMTDPIMVTNELTNAALCSAKNGKPEATVVWSTERNLALQQTNMTSEGIPPYTKTYESTLYVAPNKYYNQEPFMCTVSHPALPGEKNVTVIVLNVQYPPDTPAITVTNDGTTLTCTSNGNPNPTIVWTMPPGSPTATVVSETVPMISPSDPARQNDSYTCTASNGIDPQTSKSITTGEASTVVAMVNQSNTGMIVGAVIGSILLVAIIIALVYWFVIRPSKDKDEGPYNPQKVSQHKGESPWLKSSSRPTIEHANESLNRGRPPSPNDPPPRDEEEHRDGSGSSQSDMDDEGHDVDINSPLTEKDPNNPSGGIISRNSVNFQPYWRNSVSEARRHRPSTSPYRQSQKSNNDNRQSPEPQSDPHYEVPPREYYEDEYNEDSMPLADDYHQEAPDDRFYDLPEDRYPDYRYPQQPPPQRIESLPPYSDVHYASIDHSYKKGDRNRTRPPYEEPVEYAQIRSSGQIV